MKTYEQLRAKVYSIIYDGEIPLEFGCEVVFGRKNMEYIIVVEADNESEFEEFPSLIYKYDENDGKNLNFAHLLTFESLNTEFGTSKILGKPLELQDVLRAIEENQKWVGIAITSQGLILDKEKKDIRANAPYLSTGLRLNLSKKMWEQDEETLKKLLDLIS